MKMFLLLILLVGCSEDDTEDEDYAFTPTHRWETERIYTCMENAKVGDMLYRCNEAIEMFKNFNKIHGPDGKDGHIVVINLERIFAGVQPIAQVWSASVGNKVRLSEQARLINILRENSAELSDKVWGLLKR